MEKEGAQRLSSRNEEVGRELGSGGATLVVDMLWRAVV